MQLMLKPCMDLSTRNPGTWYSGTLRSCSFQVSAVAAGMKPRSFFLVVPSCCRMMDVLANSLKSLVELLLRNAGTHARSVLFLLCGLGGSVLLLQEHLPSWHEDALMSFAAGTYICSTSRFPFQMSFHQLIRGRPYQATVTEA